jgi:hypothetical protein
MRLLGRLLEMLPWVPGRAPVALRAASAGPHGEAGVGWGGTSGVRAVAGRLHREKDC